MENQYRLRKHGKFVGYAREMNQKYMFSRDGFWWSGTEILYDDKDCFTGVKDCNRKKIFVGDVVEWKDNDLLQKGIVVWGKDKNCVIKNPTTQQTIPLFFEGESVAFANNLKVIGYVVT